MLSTAHSLDPLLKRPFSIHRLCGNDLQILYRVVGKGTDLLSKNKKGEILDVIGPLGNSFPSARKQDKTILIAGGLGIAPIFALAEKMKNKNPVLFYGARSKKELLFIDDLKCLGIEPVISTDDGSSGKKGNIVNALSRHLTRHPSSVTHSCFYACGPKPMLKALSVLAKRAGLKGYVALEQSMACGIGTCLGCVVNTKNGFKRVCKEGPVFPIEEIIWNG